MPSGTAQTESVRTHDLDFVCSASGTSAGGTPLLTLYCISEVPVHLSADRAGDRHASSRVAYTSTPVSFANSLHGNGMRAVVLAFAPA